ncbi:MAG: hypothetical protein ACYTGB_10700, partial [Planctomycetota bacterium]
MTVTVPPVSPGFPALLKAVNPSAGSSLTSTAMRERGGTDSFTSLEVSILNSYLPGGAVTFRAARTRFTSPVPLSSA